MHRRFVRYGSTYASVYRSSIENPEKFWNEQAQKIFWFKRWNKVYDKNNLVKPHWFQDGQLNMTYNCLDRHISNHANQLAIIHDSPMTGKVTHITYQQLLTQVKTLSNVLTNKYHVKKGDVVLIYMPMIPQAIVAMLASARIGAIHNLVFGGFSANELAIRIKHSQPKLIISGKEKSFIQLENLLKDIFCFLFKVNIGFEPQRTINYKTIVDEAIKKSDIHNDSLQCIIFNRSEGKQADLTVGRDRDWNDLMDSARDISDCEPVEANHPLYLLYTSGITEELLRDKNNYSMDEWISRYDRYSKSYRSSNWWLRCHVTMDNEICI
jgi:propionyl-CoA synthetase